MATLVMFLMYSGDCLIDDKLAFAGIYPVGPRLLAFVTFLIIELVKTRDLQVSFLKKSHILLFH